MRVLAVIPARMGSQRLPRKNLMEIEPGISLVQHAIDCARFSGVVDRVCYSSDEEIYGSGAQFVRRPDEISGPTADIAAAVKHATEDMERSYKEKYDFVVTLQPAVLARSPLIVQRLVSRILTNDARGGLTMAVTHRWIWKVGGMFAENDWHGGPYPRSQDDKMPRRVEINAVQVTHRDDVGAGRRWAPPLVIMDLPPWAAALDIDTPEDMAMARDLWPWAKLRLETWTGDMRQIREVHQCK